MSKLLKQVLVAIVVVVAFLGGRWLWPNNASDVSKDLPLIGVIQVIDHPALDQTRQGIIDELAEAGLIAGKTIQWHYESAQGNPALASQIAQKFAGNKAKIIVALGTAPAQAAAKVTQSSPGIAVVFSSVTDPIGTKLVLDPKSPEHNITGVSNFIDVDRQFKLFQKIIQGLKRLGIIYNPGEANSVALLEKMQIAAKERDMVLVTAPASKTSEVLQAAQSLIGKVDALFVNNDNTALAAFDGVGKIGLENKIPVFVSDVDCLDRGALAALGPDQYKLGRQTGKMIIKILKQGLKPSAIPVEWPKDVDFKFNLPIAQQLGIQFEDELISQAEQMGNE